MKGKEQMVNEKIGRKYLLLAFFVSIISTAATLFSDLNLGLTKNLNGYLVYIILYFCLFFGTSFIGLKLADKVQLIGLLTNAKIKLNDKMKKFIIYGILIGILLGALNTFIYFQVKNSPNLPEWLKTFHGVYDTFILSARASLMEETIFRLFLFSLLVWGGMKVREKWKIFEKGLNYKTVVIIAIIVSSGLFGVMHGSGFIIASIAGVILAIVYWKAGWESCVIAHFIGNFMAFSIVFL
jgi:membrane protease YdiL (CAAX protease family)